LVDLNSTGGTYINGNKITESILYPGDVISLAGVTLIYRQHDVPPRADMKGTEPFSGSDPDGRSEPHFSSDES
jgi:pSer/pThr/pTyr-binding forkhead associated (FHA) protein